MANYLPPDSRARRQLDLKLASLIALKTLSRPHGGWIRAIRDGLGMTAQQLAERMAITRPSLSALEKGEVNDTISLRKLKEAAEALDCRLVYAFVPNTSLEEKVLERAERMADAQLARMNHTMRLENQALGAEDLGFERKRLIEGLLRGDPRRLWDEP